MKMSWVGHPQIFFSAGTWIDKTKTLKEREEALEQDAHEDFDADAQIQREEAKQDLASEETTPEPG